MRFVPGSYPKFGRLSRRCRPSGLRSTEESFLGFPSVSAYASLVHAPGVSIAITPSDRQRLEAVARDRNATQKHAWRAVIVLLSADGVGTNEIMRRTGKSKTCVWRWLERFMTAGFNGLLRDKTRPSRFKPLGPAIAERVVAQTLTDPPVEATHWTADIMAKSAGINASAVRRIWKAHGCSRIAVGRSSCPTILTSC